MALEYDEARRQAEAWVDALNRRDLDAAEAGLHDEMTNASPFVDRHLGSDESRLEGKLAYREFLRWVWAEQPHQHVLEEVFIGPQGYAFLTHFEHDGTRVFFVREVDADGLVRHQRVYHARPSAS
jgi:hypothetical protein